MFGTLCSLGSFVATPRAAWTAEAAGVDRAAVAMSATVNRCKLHG
jgi:hypothetical protein